MTPRIHIHTYAQQHTLRRSDQRGGMLIEGMVSLLLIGLAALAVVGLQANAIRIDNNAHYRHTATLAAADLASEMLLTKQQKSIGDTGTWTKHLEKLPDAQLEINNAPDADQIDNHWVMNIQISWMPPSNPANERESLSTRITIPKGSI